MQTHQPDKVATRKRRATIFSIIVILIMLLGTVITLTRPFSTTNAMAALMTANTAVNQKQAVEITSPQDQSLVDRQQKLNVIVHFDTAIKVTDSNGKTHYLDSIAAVELLLNGKSIVVNQLKLPQKVGDVTFTIGFDSLPQDATQAQLQAQVYHVYTPSQSATKTNTPDAASSIVTVIFQTDHPVVFTAGQEIQVNTASIGQTGGSITLTAGPDSVKGIRVDFPAGALPQTTTVSVGYNTGSVVPNEGTYAGVAFTLDT